MMVGKWFLIPALALFIATMGYFSYAHEVRSITLVCTKACQRLPQLPFEQRKFTSGHDLQTFKQAIGKAVKLEGELDYEALFWMNVSYRDGSETKYDLSIYNKPGQNAFLVKNGSRGFSIRGREAEELRRVIYGE